MFEQVAEPRGPELIRRYRANYGIQEDYPLTEAMILDHWEHEKRLARRLLASTCENRWDVFAECYSELYARHDWLNEQVGRAPKARAVDQHAIWARMVGRPVQYIYEIGSGRGELAYYLASRGHQVKATEITRERGEKWSCEHANLAWGISDGIHLADFEPVGTYDVVISDQVIEHMHPDDLEEHICGVLAILKPGGRYILRTPHVAAGPSDVSRVFKCDRPLGMHLKEYTNQELAGALRRAGFGVATPFRFPARVASRAKLPPALGASRPYLTYLCLAERALMALPSQPLRRRVAALGRLAGFQPDVTLIARKRR